MASVARVNLILFNRLKFFNHSITEGEIMAFTFMQGGKDNQKAQPWAELILLKLVYPV